MFGSRFLFSAARTVASTTIQHANVKAKIAVGPLRSKVIVQRMGAALTGGAGLSLFLLQARDCTNSPLQCEAMYPGTSIPIKTDGVSFPVAAICEVGEAGKSCDGSSTQSGVAGYIKFSQVDAETCVIEYEISGLKPGLHGFHIHEKADFSKGCASAGPHYNPFKKLHAGQGDLERHVGDLGNVLAGEDGIAVGRIEDKFVKLFGDFSVIGGSVMVHADPDDCGRGALQGYPEKPLPAAPAQHTKTTGNAGARIGCGAINLL